MSQVINTNMPSLIAQRNLDTSSSKMATCLQRLSSGLRINSAKDDAAGLSIATRMQSSISGLTVAKRNANDAVSLSQIAEGALQETTTILQRARELAVQSANGTNASTDRQALQAEVNQIKSSMASIANETTFNGLKLLDGSLAATEFQVGAMQNQTVVVSIADTRTTALGSNNLDISGADGLSQANYATYQESNGTAMAANANAANQNAVAATSTIVLTPISSDGTNDTATTITPTANSTAAQLATNINTNAGSLAKASAFTSVSLTNFSTLSNANTLTIGINKTAGAATAGPVINTAGVPTFSAVATAINADSSMQAAGVYAVASSSDVKVYSPDGFDIFVDSAGTATCNMQVLDNQGTAIGGNTALAAGAFVVGAGVLSLETQENVKASFGDTGLFNAAPTSSSGVRSTQTTNRTAAQTINVQGNKGSKTLEIAAHQTAADIAVAVNNTTSTTGVSATVETKATLKNLSVDGTVNFELYGDNASKIAVSAAITTADFTQLVQAINDVTGATGITATTNGANNVIELTNKSGKDIKILNFNHSAGVSSPAVSTSSPVAGDGSTLSAPSFQSIEVVGNAEKNTAGKAVTLYAGGARDKVDSTVIGGEVTFTSASSFSVSSNVDGATYSGSLFNKTANTSSSSVFSSVDLIDISTASGAQDAISVIDQALNKVSATRANLGAIQSRFESTMRNLSNNIENLESAMSRIMDTDFAEETAALTKAQILSQAGISILSQANSLPQSALQLLG